MTLDPMTLLAILGMALATLACRWSGLLIADRFQPAGRARAALDAIPPAVLAAVVAPTALGTGPAETLACLVTALAAWRLPLLPTIAIGVAAVLLFRAVL
jgi:uncharacterized membrane protein